MAQPTRTAISLTAVTTGTGTTLELGPEAYYITVYIASTGTISAGAIQIEEAVSSAEAGTWAAVGTPVTVPTSGNQEAASHVVGVYAAIRARVSTTITGGGTATVTIMASPVR